MTTSETVMIDRNTPLDVLQQEAKKGNPNAQYYLAKHYSGKRIAVKWIHKATELGNADAQYDLAWHYLLGRGVPEDKIKAVEWFRKSAEQGNVDAQYMLGTCYWNGYVPENTTEAIKWWKKAAEQGNAMASLALGMFYDGGDVPPKNCAEDDRWQTANGNGWLGKGTAMVGCGTFAKVKIRPYTEEEKKQFGEKIMPYTEEEATKIIEISQKVKQKRELSDMRKRADQKRN